MHQNLRLERISKICYCKVYLCRNNCGRMPGKGIAEMVQKLSLSAGSKTNKINLVNVYNYCAANIGCSIKSIDDMTKMERIQ